MLMRAFGERLMFDVYLSGKRDHLLVVAKGQPIPPNMSPRQWHKKKVTLAVSPEIKSKVQSEGFYRRSLAKSKSDKQR